MLRVLSLLIAAVDDTHLKCIGDGNLWLETAGHCHVMHDVHAGHPAHVQQPSQARCSHCDSHLVRP